MALTAAAPEPYALTFPSRMSVLLCTFASARSGPERIRRWISYLEGIRAAHEADEDTTEMIDRLLQSARGWLEVRDANLQ